MRVEDLPTTAAHPGSAGSEDAASGTAVLESIAQRVRWTAAAIVDAANRGRPNTSGIKVGGHQASSASMVEIMTSLWFSELTEADRVSVKPHASPVLHAINYLLGDLDENKLGTLRQKGGLQSYPSRSKDPDTVDFSTGSVGIGATATIWAAMSHRFVSDRYAESRKSGRFIGLLGDAELDEGAIWEAGADPTVAQLGELLWIVDLNRQSLDRVVPDSQIMRLQGMFEAAGWQVLTRKWGTRVQELFTRPGGVDLHRRLETMPNEEYQRLLRSPDSEIFDRLRASGSTPAMETLLSSLTAAELAVAVRDLGGHDIGLLLDTYNQVDPTRPTVIFAYTIKGRGLATEGHPNNHSALLSKDQMETLAETSGMDLDDPWRKFQPDSRRTGLRPGIPPAKAPATRTGPVPPDPGFPAVGLRRQNFHPSRTGTVPVRPETGSA
jgi:pyruvate dehydrogenase E1 component